MSVDPKITRAGIYGQVDEALSPLNGYSREQSWAVVNEMLRIRTEDLLQMHEAGLPDSTSRLMYDQGRRDVAGVVEELKTRVPLTAEVSHSIADLDHDGLMSQQLGAEAVEQYGRAPAQREQARSAAMDQAMHEDTSVEDFDSAPEGWGALTPETMDEMAQVQEQQSKSKVDFSREVGGSQAPVSGRAHTQRKVEPEVIAHPNPQGVRVAEARAPKHISETLRKLENLGFKTPDERDDPDLHLG